MIHSLLLLGLFFLTQRLSPVEKKIIEIDFSVENLRNEVSDVKASKQKERTLTNLPSTNKEQTLQKPTEEIQPPPPPVKDEPKEPAVEQSIQREELSDSSFSFPVSERQEREEESSPAQAMKDTKNPSGLLSPQQNTNEEKNTSLEESFLREKLSVISNIVQKRINYPTIAKRMGWEGRVLISFVLEPSGEIKELRVLKSSGYDILDREAVDTIKRSYREFPKPPISVLIKLPIAFRLE